MSNDEQDIAVVRYLREIGLAKPEQIAQGLALQGRALEKGETIPLAEALVRAGIITAHQRENAEKQVSGRQGIQQLLHYRLVRKIGEGSTGVVYQAEDVDTRRAVALKVLGMRFARNEKFILRLRREADAAAVLKHENIVRAFAYGEDQGRHFYVMEYCEGETLDRQLRRVGPLSARQATGLVIQAARGLKYAHEKGFIHRDIKPANIIMAGDAAKILDLGLSKNIESDAASVLTMAGAAMGTPNYISPEQALGRKDVDGRSDIYSLGATFYHLVTGVPPFHGSSGVEVLFKHVKERLPDPRDIRPEVPEGVAHVIRRMMAKDRGDRYRDCGELLTDLQGLVEGRAPLSQAIGEDRSSVALPRIARGPVARPSTTRRIPLAEPPARRRPLLPWVWVGLGGAVVIIPGLVLLLILGRKPPPPRPPPAPAPVPAVPARAEPENLDRFLDDIRALVRDPSFTLRRRGEVDGMLDAAGKAAGPRRSEVEDLRAECLRRFEGLEKAGRASLLAARVREALEDLRRLGPRRKEIEDLISEVGKAGFPDEAERLRVQAARAFKEAGRRMDLLGHWRLDGDARDSAGQGFHGEVRGARTVPGKIGPALWFDGVDDVVELPMAGELNRIQEESYTITAWFRPDDTPPGVRKEDNDSWYGIMNKQGLHIGLSHQNTGIFEMGHWAVGETRAIAQGRISHPPRAWYHLAGVVDREAGRTYLFVNGVLDGTAEWAAGKASRNYANVPWRIGCVNPGAREWAWPAKGAIDDIRLYGRALRVEEVRRLHQAGLAGRDP